MLFVLSLASMWGDVRPPPSDEEAAEGQVSIIHRWDVVFSSPPHTALMDTEIILQKEDIFFSLNALKNTAAVFLFFWLHGIGLCDEMKDMDISHWRSQEIVMPPKIKKAVFVFFLCPPKSRSCFLYTAEQSKGLSKCSFWCSILSLICLISLMLRGNATIQIRNECSCFEKEIIICQTHYFSVLSPSHIIKKNWKRLSKPVKKSNSPLNLITGCATFGGDNFQKHLW